jgi:hypothetical protein
VLSSTYQSTARLLLSSLYEPLPKHLISVLGEPLDGLEAESHGPAGGLHDSVVAECPGGGGGAQEREGGTEVLR